MKETPAFLLLIWVASCSEPRNLEHDVSGIQFYSNPREQPFGGKIILSLGTPDMGTCAIEYNEELKLAILVPSWKPGIDLSPAGPECGAHLEGAEKRILQFTYWALYRVYSDGGSDNFEHAETRVYLDMFYYEKTGVYLPVRGWHSDGKVFCEVTGLTEIDTYCSLQNLQEEVPDSGETDAI